jgi:hypothetical protein
MNSPYFVIGIAGLFAGIFASRIIMERALRLLTAEDKLKLLDGFSKLRMFGSIPLLLALGLMMGALFLPHEKIAPAYLAACVVFLASMVFQQFYVRRRLRALAVAEGYRRSAVRAQWLAQLGFLCFFGGMAATLLR